MAQNVTDGITNPVRRWGVYYSLMLRTVGRNKPVHGRFRHKHPDKCGVLRRKRPLGWAYSGLLLRDLQAEKPWSDIAAWIENFQLTKNLGNLSY